MTRPLLHRPVFTEPGISAAKKHESGFRFLVSLFLISVVCLLASAPAAEAACSNPSGNAGDLIYNYSYHVYQYCDGTTWHATGPTRTAGGTIALLQHNSAANATNATFTTQETTAGSLIVACADTRATADDTSMSASDTAGNSFSVAVGPTFLNGGGTVECLYAINNTATTNDVVTITGTPTAIQDIVLAEFSGIASSNPVDTTNAATGNSTTPSSGSTNATTNADDLIFGMCVTAGTATSGSGFTSLDSPNSNNDEYKTVSSTGSYATTWTQGNVAWVADMVAFKAAAASATCTSPTGNEADMFYNSSSHLYEFCNGTSWVAMGPTGAGGSCTSPAGNERDIIYNSSNSVMQYCNGTWVGMGY
jgi:hypothetical protein